MVNVPRPGFDGTTVAGQIAERIVLRCFLAERLKANLARAQGRSIAQLFQDRLLSIWAARGIHLPQSQGEAITARTSKRLAALHRAMDEEIDQSVRAMYGRLREDLVAVAKSEAVASIATVQQALPAELGITLNETSEVLARKIVTSRPFQGRFLRDWYGSLAAEAKRETRAAIQAGLSEGEGVPAIAARLRQNVQRITRRNAEGIVRTATQHVTSTARSEAYQANSDLIAGEKYTATLDTRTTTQCMALDGQTFDIGKGPVPPVHFNCRSVRIPVLRSWRELGYDFDQLTEGTRASMNGQVPGTVTGESWLKADPSRARKVLGAKRADMFLDGRLTLKQLLGPGLKPLTLAQLEEKFGGLVAAA